MITEWVIALIILVGPQEGTMMLARDTEQPNRSMTFATIAECQDYVDNVLPRRQPWMAHIPVTVTARTYCLPIVTVSV